MCGIVGYVGNKQAGPILLDGLGKLEYRGYDSAGIAVINNGEFSIAKAKGKLQELIDKTDGGKALPGTIGIGHTRWATHGEPSEDNAHPHISMRETVVGVHNGIIENYVELRTKLERHGFRFYSQTDTEIAINLVEYYLDKYQLGPLHAVTHAMLRIRGSYALAIMFKCDPERIYLARKDSPMIIGVKEGETYIASDVPAIIKYVNDVYYIGNEECAVAEATGVKFYNIDMEEIHNDLVHVDMDPTAAAKGGYRHFMMKEIMEQPKAVTDTLNSVLRDGIIDLTGIGLSPEELRAIDKVYIAACGSAWHVGMASQYVIEDLAGVEARAELASEMRYRNFPFSPNSLLVVISQSGETADTLAALRKAKACGVKTVAVVNVLGSSIAREADHPFYTVAGPEISVATTKAYSAQLIAMYCLALNLAAAKGKLSEDQYKGYIAEIQSIPSKIEDIFKKKQALQRLANRNANASDVFFIGRGIDYAVGLEGSLKLKEISYIHSEAYAAGELKHGTISLIEQNTLVVGILSQPELIEKTVSNIVEVKARGATVLGIDMSGEENVKKNVDNLVCVPSIDPHFAASLLVIPLQIFAYYVAVTKGLDVDKPRNLAKSVTVE